MKIACVHNADLRNNGTATYCLRALKEIDGVEAFHVRSPSDKVPKADLYLCVDDGRDDIDWLPPRPRVFWAVDTHLGYGYRVGKSKKFDKVYVAQKNAVEDFKADGVDASWLPLACSPGAHITKREFLETRPGNSTQRLERSADVAFVGFMQDPEKHSGLMNRVDFLDRFQKAVPKTWITTGAFFEDMSLRYVKSSLGLNLSVSKDLNMRVFEVMSMGVPLLTERDAVGMEDLFSEGTHYLGYSGVEEAIDQALKYTDSEYESEAKRIGGNGYDSVRKHHTYHDRMKVILEEMS